MGKKAASGALAPRPTTELEPWEQELAKEAQASKETVAGIGGGVFASIRGGRLSIGDVEFPDGNAAVIVLGSVKTKAYYEGDFDPKTPTPPVCYAFGKVNGTETHNDLVPHPESAKVQCESCKNCPHNIFGTANRGKGKACKDQIRLAFLDGGSFENGVFKPLKKIESVVSGDVAILSLPPTGLVPWASYVRGLSDNVHRPVYGVVTHLHVAPDDTTIVKLTFACQELCTKEQIVPLRARAAGVEALLVQPYPKAGAVAAPAKPGKGKKGKKDKF
jgi:hypothetical protein